ncbi:SO2930 family diheme c-type cytochrome [uncultured Paraglaciecola sp.]|uniref:SO2930 family diheme c-type cytochrome n=1 Tax=uncultured Paraglaciecola sp. TaxID=1765024 RepID=UPI00260EA461|nr:SO2930 family diheme c-type cytochrome [uncultured Paraglaciecola sp.]
MTNVIKPALIYAALLLITACSSDDNDDVGELSDANNATNQFSDDSEPNSAVGITLNAEDSDEDDSVSYSLSNDANGLFQVDASSGVVTLAASIADVVAAGTSTFTIEGVATSSDESTSEATFTLDFAVNNPVGDITDANTTANGVSENAVNGDSVGVTALAVDASANNSVSYVLADNAGGRFAIDASSGVISVADDTMLDYETTTSHSVEVTATSSDGSTATESFNINVLDETFASGGDDEMKIVIAATESFEQDLLTALITAPSKSIIQLPAGEFQMMGELSVSTDNIILRGAGMGQGGGLPSTEGFSPKLLTNISSINATVLKFDNQVTGSQGLNVTGNNFVVEDLAIENTIGDAIKITGTSGVVIRRVRVEWTSGANTDNGAYGLYPVQTKNVLIEDSLVRGASDAGVYVGQSEKIIVRRNFVYENVAGIEIENSKFADVYENETTANTGGILVFDLPGPPVQGGEATRVFNNMIYDNNTPNFAPAGNIVGQVPAGTGVMIMANDDVQVFENTITGNISAAATVVSYYIVDATVSKPTYDPVPEKIYFYNNEMANNSTDPQGMSLQISAGIFAPQGVPTVDIFYDSSGVNAALGLLKEFPAGLPESRRICIQEAQTTTIGGINAAIALGGIAMDPNFTINPDDFNCAHASLPAVVLDPLDPDSVGETVVDTQALCSAQGSGVNKDAFVADCPKLSDYRLFADKTNPRQGPNGQGLMYDLTTPLFTDYASKYRFVFVPDGAKAAFRATESMDFPIGTIISKTFTIQQDLRAPDTQTDELVETRLMIRRAEGWEALPYIWNADKSDATLAVAGGTQDVAWVDVNGEAQTTTYVIPNKNNCANCHGEQNIQPIGPKAKLLNKMVSVNGELINQLSHWSQSNILNSVPTDRAAIDEATIPDYSDTDASLDARARGYLDINCAHCHSAEGAARTSGLLLTYNQGTDLEIGKCKPPVAAGDGAGNLLHDIVPGDASKSILAYRLDSNELDVRMPELGRSVIHTEGVQLITQWINAMEADNCE